MSWINGNGFIPNDGLNGSAAPWAAVNSGVSGPFPQGSPGYAGYGTSSSGGLATYPIENYPTTSYLSYAVKASPEPSPEPTSASYTAFYNEGTPGQNVWTKTAGTTYTGCFDFSLTVPTSLAPGTYTASIQFNLNVAE